MDSQLASVPKLEPGKFVAWDDAITAYLHFNGWYKIVKGTTKRIDEPTSTAADTVQKVCNAHSVWDNNDEHTAGAIGLTLMPVERAEVNAHLDPGIVLYTAIHVCRNHQQACDTLQLIQRLLRAAPGAWRDAHHFCCAWLHHLAAHC